MRWPFRDGKWESQVLYVVVVICTSALSGLVSGILGWGTVAAALIAFVSSSIIAFWYTRKVRKIEGND